MLKVRHVGIPPGRKGRRQPLQRRLLLLGLGLDRLAEGSVDVAHQLVVGLVLVPKTLRQVRLAFPGNTAKEAQNGTVSRHGGVWDGGGAENSGQMKYRSGATMARSGKRPSSSMWA